jgi:hypothetical protein
MATLIPQINERVDVVGQLPIAAGPRQVRFNRCSIIYPGMEMRATNDADRSQLATQGFDITSFVQKIDIYESIWDNTISGSVTLLENIALPEYLPIVGVEVLILSFSVDSGITDYSQTTASGQTKSQDFTRAFRIVKCHNQTFPRNDARFYTLEFVTHEFINSMSHRICRPFRAMTCRDAILNILQHDLEVPPTRILMEESTHGDVDVLIPNYTPLQAINFFSLLAQTTRQPRESNFVFYETLTGFHFTSIQSLIQAGRDADASLLQTFNVNPGQAVLPMSENDTMTNIIRIHQDRAFDVLFDIGAGVLRSRVMNVDFLARRFSPEPGDMDAKEDSRYTTAFAEGTHLDDHPVYPQNFDLSVARDARLFVIPSVYWSKGSRYIAAQGDGLIDDQLHQSIALRNRQLREIQHLQTLLDIPGQPNLQAGTVINVIYPSSRPLQDNENINTPVLNEVSPYYSGKHLVTEVHHILQTKSPGSMEYRMHIKAVRDSFGSPMVGSSVTTE